MTLAIIFENPLMLWGLLLVPILIILHLLNINRYTPILFSDISLLKELLQKRKRRLQLHKWLLLLLRSIILACFVFGFANPYWSKNSEIGEPQKVAIVFDNHAYMQTKNKNGVAYIELMKQQVVEAISSFPEKTIFFLLSNNTVSNEELLDAYSVEKIITEASFSFLTKTQKQFEEEVYNLKKQGLKTVLWFSNRVLPPAFDDVETFAPEIDFSADLSNVSLDSAYVTNLGTTDKRAINLHLKVSNFTKKNLIDYPVKIFDREVLRNVFSISLSEKETKIFLFPIDFEIDETFVGRVEIEDFPQTADNQYFFNLGQNIKSHVLLLGKSNAYFEAVFDTDFSEFSHQPDNFNFNQIENSDVLIIHEIGESFLRVIPAVRKFLKKGGKLCIFPQKDLKLLNSFMKKLNLPTFGKKWKNPRLKLEYNKAFFQGIIVPSKEIQELPQIESGLSIEQNGQYFNHILTLGNIPVLTQINVTDGKVYLFSTKNRVLFEHSIFSPLMFRIAQESSVSENVYTIDRTSSFRFTAWKNFSESRIDLKNRQKDQTLSGIVLQNFNGNVNVALPVEGLMPGNYEVSANNNPVGVISFNSKRMRNFFGAQREEKQAITSSNVSERFKKRNFGYWFFIFAILVLFVEGYISKK